MVVDVQNIIWPTHITNQTEVVSACLELAFESKTATFPDRCFVFSVCYRKAHSEQLRFCI